jgi:hypothetical protein
MTKCNYCNRNAVANYQRVWIRWDVDKNGNYSKDYTEQFEMQEPIEENNLHLCAKHEEDLQNGEL